jgi:hypothetical protein
MDKIMVYLEVGKTRSFAGALEWPGWCRGGREEPAALQSLFDYGPRYARAIQTARQGFAAPQEIAALTVVERLPGGGGTDFGAPEQVPGGDAQPITAGELERQMALLRACWETFDAAAQAAAGSELRKGPRGGGRDLEKIVEHVQMAEVAYLGRLGGKLEAPSGTDAEASLHATRDAILQTLEGVALGAVPAAGPRGGKRWPVRYFVRRSAWHLLDHAWEIEDRRP